MRSVNGANWTSTASLRLLSKHRPVLASFVAAAIGLLPILAIAVFELNSPPSAVIDQSQTDDAGFRGAGLALAAAPFLYVVAVPVCYAVGALLASLGLRRLSHFLAGAAGVAVILGFMVGLLLSVPSQFGLGDVALSVAASTMFFLIVVLPAAICWWLLALWPHKPDGLPSGDASVN